MGFHDGLGGKKVKGKSSRTLAFASTDTITYGKGEYRANSNGFT